MKKIVILFLLTLCFAPFAFTEDLVAVTIINNTEYTIQEIYASMSISDSWGENLLKSGYLEWGDSEIIYLDIADDCYYDFELVDIDGDYYHKWDVSICNDTEIEFTFDDYDTGDYYDDEYYDDEYYDDEYYDDDYYSDDYYYDYDTGYNDGYSYGYSDGYREGFKEAYKEAYKEGFRAGMETRTEIDYDMEYGY